MFNQTTMEVFLYFLTGNAIGLFGKIIFDWLKNGRNNKKTNGFLTYKLFNDDLGQFEKRVCDEVDHLGDNLKFLEEDLSKMDESVRWIKRVHDQRDQDGNMIWYVPRQWKDTLDKVQESTQKSNYLLADILDELKNQRRINEVSKL